MYIKGGRNAHANPRICIHLCVQLTQEPFVLPGFKRKLSTAGIDDARSIAKCAMATNVVTKLDGVHGGPPPGGYYYAQKQQMMVRTEATERVGYDEAVQQPRAKSSEIDTLVATRVRRQLERLGKKPPEEMMHRFLGDVRTTEARASIAPTSSSAQAASPRGREEAPYDDDFEEEEEEEEEENDDENYEDDYEDDDPDEAYDAESVGDGTLSSPLSTPRTKLETCPCVNVIDKTQTVAASETSPDCDADKDMRRSESTTETQKAETRNAEVEAEVEVEKKEDDEKEEEPLVPLGRMIMNIRDTTSVASSKSGDVRDGGDADGKCIGDSNPLTFDPESSPATSSASRRTKNRPISAPIHGSPMRVAIRALPVSPPKLTERTNTLSAQTHMKHHTDKKTGGTKKKTDKVARNNAFRNEWTRKPSLPNLMVSKPRKIENYALFFKEQHQKLAKHNKKRRERVRSAATVLNAKDNMTPNERRRDDIRMAMRRKMLN